MMCYPNSFALLAEWAALGDRIRLCHGVATQGREPHVRIGHAWLEVEGVSGLVACIDSAAPDLRIPQDVYYEAGQIERGTVRRRTLAEAQERVASTGHFGPWDSEVAQAGHIEGVQ